MVLLNCRRPRQFKTCVLLHGLTVLLKIILKCKKYQKGIFKMTLEEIKKNCKPGWHLNPNEKVVNGILKGINRNDGECPCNNDSEDKKCACSNYCLKDKCCCGLYVKD